MLACSCVFVPSSGLLPGLDALASQGHTFCFSLEFQLPAAGAGSPGGTGLLRPSPPAFLKVHLAATISLHCCFCACGILQICSTKLVGQLS